MTANPPRPVQKKLNLETHPPQTPTPSFRLSGLTYCEAVRLLSCEAALCSGLLSFLPTVMWSVLWCKGKV